MNLNDLPTPALVLDLDRLERNCARMRERAKHLGVQLRPHLKTAKSAEVARVAVGSGAPRITVSTLAEAEYFAKAGFRDMTYAVGIAEAKIAPLADIQRQHGARIHLLADNPHIASRVGEAAKALGVEFDLFIEIDCGGGRGGVPADGPELLEIAQAIEASAALSLAGVLTHAGHSYHADSPAGIRRIARDEREAAVLAAERLRAAGFAVKAVSVGSTPTALMAETMDGVTEMRPGVYTLLDLDQVTLGVCTPEDIAVSVLATVIGANPRSQRLLVDAGALALSKDLSAAHQRAGIGYGQLCAIDGTSIGNAHVDDVHQEHGFVAGASFEALQAAIPVGARVRILPNHACITAAPYDRYHLVRGRGVDVLGEWDKTQGW